MAHLDSEGRHAMSITPELEGAELDAAVARAEGWECRIESWMTNPPRPAACWLLVNGKVNYSAGPYSPSTNWAQGGPIIEREGIATWRGRDGWLAVMPRRSGYKGSGYIDVGADDCTPGPTPLIAAMRCYVAAREAVMKEGM